METIVGSFSEDEEKIETTSVENVTLFNKCCQESWDDYVNDGKSEIKTELICVSVCNSAEIEYNQSDNIFDKIDINKTVLQETMTVTENNIEVTKGHKGLGDISGGKVPQSEKQYLGDIQINSEEQMASATQSENYKGCKKWKCSYCAKKFSRKDLLDTHIKAHTGNLLFVCKKCGIHFSVELEYHEHIKDMERNKCCLCGKVYAKNGSYLSHMKTHKKRYLCEYCGIKCSHMRHFQRHLKIHTGIKEFKCNDCGKGFFDRQSLHWHIKIHFEEKPFLCETCHAAFRSKALLVLHLQKHGDERPYKCRYCSKAFKYQQNLKPHERIHTGDRPFSCCECGAAFVQQASLIYHSQKYGH